MGEPVVNTYFDGANYIPGQIVDGKIQVLSSLAARSSVLIERPGLEDLSPNVFTDFGANVTLNVSATKAEVVSFACYNDNVSEMYFQLHDTATVPSTSAVPLETFLVPAGGQIVIGFDYFGFTGAVFETGLAFAFSTTRNTYTAGVAADQTTKIKFVN